MLISVLYAAFLAGIFSTSMADPWNELDNNRFMSLAKKVKMTTVEKTMDKDKIYTMNVSIVVETFQHTDQRYNERIIRNTVHEMNDMFWYLHPSHIKISIVGFHEFKNTGKPLGDYTAKELKKLLKNDAFFKTIPATTDYTQILTLGKPGRDKQVLATRFRSICSKNSRGIIIDRNGKGGGVFVLEKLLTYSLACAAGLYDKEKCLRGFRGKDLTCERGHWPSKDLRSPWYVSRKYCFLGDVGLFFPEEYWKKNRKICNRNRSRRRENGRRSKLRDTERESQKGEDDDDDEEGGMKMMIKILLAVSGVLLILAALLGAWLWIWNRKKTKKLKKRVSVKYKYSSMKRDDTPSVIRDPTVTNDLE